MKKNLFLIAITSIGLMACGGSANKTAEAENDSISNATTEVEEVVEVTKAEFMSADLKMFGLRGNVKEVSTVTNKDNPDGINYSYCRVYTGSRSLTFKDDGKWKKTEDFTILIDLANKCNDDGFMKKTSHRESDGTTYENTYEEIDENGWAHKETYAEEGPCGVFKNKFTYEYTVTDNQGNWTERKVSVDAHSESYEDGTKEDKHEEWVEVRTITYYE